MKRIDPRRLGDKRFSLLLAAFTVEGDKLVFEQPRPREYVAKGCTCSMCSRYFAKVPNERLPTEAAMFREMKRRLRNE
jgi:hypothetical protein